MEPPTYKPKRKFSPKRLKAKRVASGWTQTQLAAVLDVSKQAVINWEAGTHMPNAQVVATIADILGFDVNELFVPT